MSRSRPSDDSDFSRAERRERYEAVLRTIAHNTGRPGLPQRAGIDAMHIRVHLVGHGPYSVEAVDKALRAAIENDDVWRWRDEEGTVRYTRQTIEAVRAMIAEQAAREHPDRELIGRCNGMLQALQEDDNDG